MRIVTVKVSELIIDHAKNARLSPQAFEPVTTDAEGKQTGGRYAGDALLALTDNIRARGLLQPVGVRVVTIDGRERFELRFGFRRAVACAQIDPHYEMTCVVIHEGKSDAEAELESSIDCLSENIPREALTPFEIARELARVREHYKLHHGKRPQNRELARIAGLNEGYVSRLLSIYAGASDALKERWAHGLAMPKVIAAYDDERAAADGGKKKARARRGKAAVRDAAEPDGNVYVARGTVAEWKKREAAQEQLAGMVVKQYAKLSDMRTPVKPIALRDSSLFWHGVRYALASVEQAKPMSIDAFAAAISAPVKKKGGNTPKK